MISALETYYSVVHNVTVLDTVNLEVSYLQVRQLYPSTDPMQEMPCALNSKFITL